MKFYNTRSSTGSSAGLWTGPVDVEMEKPTPSKAWTASVMEAATAAAARNGGSPPTGEPVVTTPEPPSRLPSKESAEALAPAFDRALSRRSNSKDSRSSRGESRHSEAALLLRRQV